jgi:hypothetical protein
MNAMRGEYRIGLTDSDSLHGEFAQRAVGFDTMARGSVMKWTSPVSGTAVPYDG